MAEPCPDCTKAAAGQWHGFNWTCTTCRARQVARSQDYWRVRRLGHLDKAYRTLLGTCRVTHEEVRAAAERDAMGREGAQA